MLTSERLEHIPGLPVSSYPCKTVQPHRASKRRPASTGNGAPATMQMRSEPKSSSYRSATSNIARYVSALPSKAVICCAAIIFSALWALNLGSSTNVAVANMVPSSVQIIPNPSQSGRHPSTTSAGSRFSGLRAMTVWLPTRSPWVSSDHQGTEDVAVVCRTTAASAAARLAGSGRPRKPAISRRIPLRPRPIGCVPAVTAATLVATACRDANNNTLEFEMVSTYSTARAFCDGLIGTATPPACQLPYSTAIYAGPLGNMIATRSPGRTPTSMRQSANRAAVLANSEYVADSAPQRSATASGSTSADSARNTLTLVIATPRPTTTRRPIREATLGRGCSLDRAGRGP